ncbi:MAG: Cap [Circoviridae sp.]|nr:MAG: Cap [Circoviridae sp.]
MPRYSRYRYRRGYSRRRASYRRRYPYSRYRRWRRKSVANSGTRASTFIQIKQCGNIALTLAPGQTNTNMAIISPLTQNTTAAGTRVNTLFPFSARANPLWTTYSNLYDEFKIVSVGAKIVGVDTIGNGGQIGACKIITYWDRSTHHHDFYTNEVIQPAQLVNMPGARMHTFTNNSQIKLYTSQKASDLQERITFQDVSPSTVALNAADTGLPNNQVVVAPRSFGPGGAQAFMPALYCMIYSPIANGGAAGIPLNLMVDVYCTIQFRNPKYTVQATTSTSSKMATEFEIEAREAERLANNAAVRQDKADAIESSDYAELNGQSVTKVHFEEPMS